MSELAAGSEPQPAPSTTTTTTAPIAAASQKQQTAQPVNKETDTDKPQDDKSASAPKPAEDDAAPETTSTQACPLITSANANGVKNDTGIDNVNPADFRGSVETNNELPSVATLKRIENYTVLDRHGKSHPFKSLYTGPNVARRVLVIFVRHFYCGNCQEYLKILSASISPDALLRLPISTFIAVVGCGNPGLIDMYAEATGCPFPIYADPTRKLYDELGMVKSLALGDRPAYMQKQSLLSSTVVSIFQGLKQVKTGLALKGGDQRQIGGEFLFEPFNAVTPTEELDKRMVARGKASMRKATMESTQSPTDGADDSPLKVGDGTNAADAGEASKGGGGDEDGEEGQKGQSLDGREYHNSNEIAEEKRVTWCHRMRSTRDHAEIPELAEILGVDVDAHVLAAGHAPAPGNAEQSPAASRTSTSSNSGSGAAPSRSQQRWSRVLSERKGTGSNGTMASQIDEMKRNAAAATTTTTTSN